ncbi:MAG: ABC transporter ATP-binding protein, partial [Lentisphaeria bacterium]|nr:ABC transporter ATP-binding protein [Lentisphaeria bacterium]
MYSKTTEFTSPNPLHTNRGGPMRWVVSHALRHWFLGVMGLVGALGNAATGCALPVLFGAAVTCVSADTPDMRRLLWLALGMAGSQLARLLLQFLRGASFEGMAQRIERDARDDLYGELLGKSMTFHSLQPVGEVMARATNDVREINFMFSPGLNWACGSVMFLIVPVIVSPRYHPQLIATPLVFVALYIVALWLHLRMLKPTTEAVRASFGALNTVLSESLDGVELVKGATGEAGELQRIGAQADRYRDAIVRQGDVEATFLPMLLLSVALPAGLLHALLLYRAGALGLGQVVGYFGVLLMLEFPTFASLFAYSRLSSGLAAASRVLEMINQANDLDENDAGHSGAMRGHIVFDAVTFGYGSAQSALSDVSFTVEVGQTVAVVGETGSGKTTLAKLVNRTYETTSGRVSIDGVDVRDWRLADLRRGISIIEQDVFLFSKTVAENISFGRPDATRAEIETAAKAAQAHDFISSFHEGYDTVVGERGTTLSGGQRQRVALARAFLADPRILILDDSTSAVDSATEDSIQRAIHAAAEGRTTLIITHR